MSTKFPTKKAQVLNLDTININTLAEIQGKKETIQKVIKDNPVVVITDSASYELAKKSRTTVRTERTGIVKEGNSVLNKIKEIFTDPVKKIYAEFETTLRTAEDERQAEVTKWETAKEKERLEKIRLEEARKQKHRDEIDEYYTTYKTAIGALNFTESENFEIKSGVEPIHFEEFADNFEAKVEMLKVLLSDKKRQMQQAEDLRLEQERLEKERADRERADKIKASIDTWYNRWENNIENYMEFEDIHRVSTEFQEEPALKVEEFQSLYAEKRSQLVTKLSNRTKFLRQQNELAEQQKALEKQAQDLLIATRKQQLVSLGFDKDGAYAADGLMFVVSEDDLLADDAGWEAFIARTQDRINQNNTPAAEEIEVHQPEYPATPDECFTSDEIAYINEPTDTAVEYQSIQDVDFEDEPLTSIQQEAKSIIFGFYNYCMGIDGELREYHIYDYVKTL